MKKHIAFDFDGTLVDTEELIYRSWQAVFKKYTGEENESEKIYKTFGETVAYSMDNFFPQDDNNYEKITYFRDFQKQNQDRYIKEFDGIGKLLKYLKDEKYLLSVVTSRKAKTTYEYLEKFKLRKFFDVIITCDDVKEHKPAPEPLLKAIERLSYMASTDINKRETIMIGDTYFDIDCAYNAGVCSVLACWDNNKTRNNIKYFANRPDYIIEKPEELIGVIKNA